MASYPYTKTVTRRLLSRFLYLNEDNVLTMDGEQLLNSISYYKKANRSEAEKAFALFCGLYETRATQIATVLCERWKKPESFVYQIVYCAFQKVWLYPSFDKNKSRINDTDRAILNWINWILIHELTLLSQRGDCSHPEEEDLPIITNTYEFIGEYFKDDYVSVEETERMRVQLERLLSGLSEQELTIYLTYKVYDRPGKKIPRNVLKKLRTRFNISQDGIRQCHWRVKQQIEG